MSVYHLAIPYTYHGVWGVFEPTPLQFPPFLLLTFTKQSNISAMQDCLHNRLLKIKYSFLLSVFLFISHMKSFFFNTWSAMSTCMYRH